MKRGSSPGGDAVACERGHLLGLDPVEQSVECRHETWVLEPNATPSLVSMTTGWDVNLSPSVEDRQEDAVIIHSYPLRDCPCT